MMDLVIGKEQFLIEHNKLSPENMQATFALLTKFQEEKRPLLKDNEWSHKLRIPFMSWLASLPQEEKKKTKKKSEISEYKVYPFSDLWQ